MNYFGYGSLVNRETRPLAEKFAPASVSGWQRIWGHRVSDACAAQVAGTPRVRGYSVLSVQPAARCSIDGVMVPISAIDLPALDARERGYARHTVTSIKSTDPVAMYVSLSEHVAMASTDYPLLQSYVDCVLAGFLAVFGWEGVDRFFATTAGWAAPVLADRHSPLYARAVHLPEDLTANFDERIVAARSQT